MGSEAYPNTAMTFEQLKRKDEALQTSATGALDQRPGSQSGLAAAVAAADGVVVEPAGQIAAPGAIDWQTIHVLVFTGAELGSLERNYGFSPYATTRAGGQCLLVPPHKLECCLISKRGAEKHAQRRRRCSVVSPSSRLWPVLSLRCSSVVVLFTAARYSSRSLTLNSIMKFHRAIYLRRVNAVSGIPTARPDSNRLRVVVVAGFRRVR